MLEGPSRILPECTEVERCRLFQGPDHDSGVWTDPRDALEFLQGGVEHATEVFEPREKRLRVWLDISPRDGEGQQKLQDLVVVEPGQAGLSEPLSESGTVTLSLRQRTILVLLLAHLAWSPVRAAIKVPRGRKHADDRLEFAALFTPGPEGCQIDQGLPPCGASPSLASAYIKAGGNRARMEAWERSGAGPSRMERQSPKGTWREACVSAQVISSS
jgi:hypothetical protein